MNFLVSRSISQIWKKSEEINCRARKIRPSLPSRLFQRRYFFLQKFSDPDPQIKYFFEGKTIETRKSLKRQIVELDELNILSRHYFCKGDTFSFRKFRASRSTKIVLFWRKNHRIRQNREGSLDLIFQALHFIPSEFILICDREGQFFP